MTNNPRPPLSVDDLTQTRETGQHMVFTGDGRKRLQLVLDGQRLPWFKRLLRWLKRWSDKH